MVKVKAIPTDQCKLFLIALLGFKLMVDLC